LMVGPRQSAASHMVADFRVRGRTTGQEPLFDLFHDLRDAGVVELQLDGDGPLRIAPDSDALIDQKIALARWREAWAGRRRGLRGWSRERIENKILRHGSNFA